MDNILIEFHDKKTKSKYLKSLEFINHRFKNIFNSVYIACTTWLAISLLMFYVAYSGKLEKFESFRKIIAILTTIDTLILISNIFTHKIFTLHYHEMIFGPGGYVFSKLPLYMIHSIYVYSICLTLFIILFRNLFKIPNNLN